MIPISHEQMLRWLRESDDSVAVEFPAAFDYAAAIHEVETIKPKLEQIIGRELRMDRNVQDASYFTDLAYIQPSEEPRTWHTIFAIFFSAFGRLTTIWSACPEDMKISVEARERVIEELMASGFRYVDVSLLSEPYDGIHPLFVGSNWYTRFFDYV